MDLTPVSREWSSSDPSWLASQHGTDAPITITVEGSASGGLVKATHYPQGYLRGGLVLGRITATGLYGLYDNAASDGRQTAAGFLMGDHEMRGNDIGAALLWHGAVRLSRLPVALDTAGQADLASRFLFVA